MVRRNLIKLCNCCGQLLYHLTSRRLLDRLQTRQQLFRRGVLQGTDDPRCAFCHVELETAAHLMSSCTRVREVWALCNSWTGGPLHFYDSPRDHLRHFAFHGWSRSQRVCEIAVWRAVVWSVWLHRNDIIFRDAVLDIDYLLDMIQFRSWNWVRHKVKGVGFSLFEWKIAWTLVFTPCDVLGACCLACGAAVMLGGLLSCA
ncbi:uncharacterized protein LOC130720014 [Lotus japonicus]|uniref:uncharacterized protein LOC130720014 n=1 Tax=Lotus japonicus TaxID=34305 RepID=UPI00258960D9|nr:uncharacterized protein LOC130720014 [Lotus japonicus]